MKKAKRILCLVLALVMVLGITPSINAQAKAPKLNCTKKTVYIGDNFQLKVKNYKKIIKWSSSDIKVCDVSNGYVFPIGEGTCTITAKCGKKKLTCKVTVKLDTAHKLSKINNWLVGDIWNKGFCDLNAYAEWGTDSCGETMDINYSLKKLNKAYPLMEEYTDFINSLTDSRYDELKETWVLMKSEGDKLIDKANSLDWNNVNEDDFDVSMFSRYMNDLLPYLY